MLWNSEVRVTTKTWSLHSQFCGWIDNFCAWGQDQWAQYCFVCNEIMSDLPEDSERSNERDRFNGQTWVYERYSFLIEQFLTCAELQRGEKGSKVLSAQEPGISKECVSFPRDAQNPVLTGSQKSRRSSPPWRLCENAAVESVLAEAILTQIKRESLNSSCYC